MIELTRLWSKQMRPGQPMLIGRLAGARIYVLELPEPDERGATHRVMLSDASETRTAVKREPAP